MKSLNYFGNIRCENASFRILQDSIWLQVIYFLTTIAFWFTKYIFWMDRDHLRALAKDFPLSSIYRSNQPLWKIHDIAYINFDCFTIGESNLKIALGTRLINKSCNKSHLIVHQKLT